MIRSLNPVVAWPSVLMVSILLHALMVLVLQSATTPDPVAFTEDIKAAIGVSSVSVPSDQAQEAEAEADTLESQSSRGERMGVSQIASSRARPVPPASQTVATQDNLGEKLVALERPGDVLAPGSAPGGVLKSSLPASESVTAAAPAANAIAATAASTEPLAPTRPSMDRVDASQPDANAASAVLLSATAAAAIEATGQILDATAPTGALVAAATAPGPSVVAAAPTGQALASTPAPSAVLSVAQGESLGVAAVQGDRARLDVASPAGERLGEQAHDRLASAIAASRPDATAVTADVALAWSGDLDSVLDEKSLAAIQAFMQPKAVTQSAAYAGNARDEIGAALSQFPCSRLQAAFLPETGGIEIRGHVPVAELQPKVVALLEGAVGGAIPVGGSLLVLPAPQCGVLDAMEGLGVPQSRDQVDDPLVVGREAQAKLLSFEEGQPVAFSLQAPEYNAHVYLDYYDKDGKVIHVVPSEFIGETWHQKDELFVVGGGADGSDFQMRAAPPFGQDIAVVVAASEPLYEGLRPLIEDAASYLAWLHGRMTELEAQDPNFQGEWVYLFVRTGPKGSFTSN